MLLAAALWAVFCCPAYAVWTEAGSDCAAVEEVALHMAARDYKPIAYSEDEHGVTEVYFSRAVGKLVVVKSGLINGRPRTCMGAIKGRSG
jgi:hypothetical protein